MKIAIGYFGLIRGFKYAETFDSHIKLIYNELRSQGYEIDVFISTYNKDYDVMTVDRLMRTVRVAGLFVESDSIATKRLTPIANKFIYPTNFYLEAGINLIKCWSSQQRLRQMLIDSGENYERYIIMDIGQKLMTKMVDIKTLDPEIIYTPNFGSHTGLNGRMIIGDKKNIYCFLNKFRWITEQNPPICLVTPEVLNIPENRVNPPTLHPESSYLIYLDLMSIKHQTMDVKFCRHRTDGTLLND